jgi:AraC family transcriptional regulator, transcriptional activator of the genes for pyochelin and ferripyochelin receptors
MPRKKQVEGYDHPIERTKLYDIPALELAKSFIDQDPEAHVDILTLADKAGINEFKLKLGFRELFRTSPYQYRLHLRLEKARALLEETDYSISEIAFKVGFETYPGFSTAFKKVYQISPTGYRNQQ